MTEPMGHSEMWGQPPDVQPRTPAQRARDKEEKVDEKVAVPPRTMRDLAKAESLVQSAVVSLDQAAQTLQHLAPRISTLLENIAAQTGFQHAQIIALREGVEEVQT